MRRSGVRSSSTPPNSLSKQDGLPLVAPAAAPGALLEVAAPLPPLASLLPPTLPDAPVPPALPALEPLAPALAPALPPALPPAPPALPPDWAMADIAKSAAAVA